jgi:hypothetical protein
MRPMENLVVLLRGITEGVLRDSGGQILPHLGLLHVGWHRPTAATAWLRRAGAANERYGCRRVQAEEAHQQSAHVPERQAAARRPGRPVSSRLPTRGRKCPMAEVWAASERWVFIGPKATFMSVSVHQPSVIGNPSRQSIHLSAS